MVGGTHLLWDSQSKFLCYNVVVVTSVRNRVWSLCRILLVKAGCLGVCGSSWWLLGSITPPADVPGPGLMAPRKSDRAAAWSWRHGTACDVPSRPPCLSVLGAPPLPAPFSALIGCRQLTRPGPRQSRRDGWRPDGSRTLRRVRSFVSVTPLGTVLCLQS